MAIVFELRHASKHVFLSNLVIFLSIQLQNRAFRSYPPRISFECPSVPADRSRCSCVRAGISCALRSQSERKIYSLLSSVRVPSSLSASRARIPFRRELSNSGTPVNVHFYGLVTGPCPTYYGSSSIRPLSQIAKAQNHIFTTEGGSSGKNGRVNTFNKRWNSPIAFASRKGNAASKEEVAKISSSGKAAAVEDADPSSLNGQIVKDNYNSLVDNGAQAPKGRAKPRRSRKNTEQSQSSSIAACTEVAEAPDSCKKITGAKETTKGYSEQSHISPKVRCRSFFQV